VIRTNVDAFASALPKLRHRRLARARQLFARPHTRLLATGPSTRSRSYRAPAHIGASAFESPAHVGARPVTWAAHIGASAVGSADHAMARLATSPAHISASAFESPAHVCASATASLAYAETPPATAAAHVGAPPLPPSGLPLVKRSAVPQPRRARPLRVEGGPDPHIGNPGCPGAPRLHTSAPAGRLPGGGTRRLHTSAAPPGSPTGPFAPAASGSRVGVIASVSGRRGPFGRSSAASEGGSPRIVRARAC